MNHSLNPFAAPDHGIDQHVQAVSGESRNFRYMGFWKRVLATIIDTISFGIAFLPLSFALSAFIENPLMAELSYSILSSILGFVVIIIFWQYKQSTPGKMIFSAKIVDEVTLKKPTLGKFIIRNLGYFPSTLVFGIGFIWIAFDQKKRGWHDLMAGTIVITPEDITTRRAVRRPVKSDAVSPE
jgi:uncharacterized RDD family membrane protein YckC